MRRKNEHETKGPYRRAAAGPSAGANPAAHHRPRYRGDQNRRCHHVLYGKAEGRAVYYINAAGNPKTGATIYKNALEGTAYGNDNHNYNSIVPATYLDTLPPSSNDQAYDPWMLYQLTRPQNMTNAKLVAEYYSIMDVIENKKTRFNYNLVHMDRRSNIVGELSARCRLFEAVYCYENNLKSKIGSYKVEKESDAAGLKSQAE